MGLLHVLSSGLISAQCFQTDFARWVAIGGGNASGHPVIALWDMPDQRELCTWQLEGDKEIRFLIRLPASKPGEEEGRPDMPFLSASSNGNVSVLMRPEGQ